LQFDKSKVTSQKNDSPAIQSRNDQSKVKKEMKLND